jgi:hypothetical protein
VGAGIGGDWQDGVFPIGWYSDPSLQSVREMFVYINYHHTVTDPFDIVINGRVHKKNRAGAEALLRHYVDAGVA